MSMSGGAECHDDPDLDGADGPAPQKTCTALGDISLAGFASCRSYPAARRLSRSDDACLVRRPGCRSGDVAEWGDDRVAVPE